MENFLWSRARGWTFRGQTDVRARESVFPMYICERAASNISSRSDFCFRRSGGDTIDLIISPDMIVSSVLATFFSSRRRVDNASRLGAAFKSAHRRREDKSYFQERKCRRARAKVTRARRVLLFYSFFSSSFFVLTLHFIITTTIRELQQLM